LPPRQRVRWACIISGLLLTDADENHAFVSTEVGALLLIEGVLLLTSAEVDDWHIVLLPWSVDCIWRRPVVEEWICLFEGRTGAKARAVFATEEQAKRFAEQHAQVSTSGMPLKWNDNSDPLVLTTPLGMYRILRTGQPA